MSIDGEIQREGKIKKDTTYTLYLESRDNNKKQNTYRGIQVRENNEKIKRDMVHNKNSEKFIKRKRKGKIQGEES